MKREVTVYYGPKSAFLGILPQDVRHTTLIELAIKSDAKAREHTFKISASPQEDKKDRIQCLVAYSDEYAAISENAINSFIGFVSQFDLDRVFLQNPPLYIVEQFVKLKQDVTIKKYTYAPLGQKVMRAINEHYNEKIIGQPDVKDKLLTALFPLCRSWKQQKPVVILFYGPTGVGKTETAKMMSDLLGEKLFRKQLSMFHSDDFASYLFGGRHSQNCLAKELLERESNIILFDEFDKPDPVFHSAFYQLFDEGVFEDKNYYVEVYNSIIICTSNYLSAEDARRHLGDPIFSRFDAVIRYDALGDEAVRIIMHNELRRQMEDLDPDERSAVEESDIVSVIEGEMRDARNARQIKRVVRDAISNTLLDRVLYPEKYGL